MDVEPCLTIQNPTDVVGETVFDCRPSVLPVSIPLLGFGPGMMAEARPSEDVRPLEETGKSIMDMDTNEITINRIVGFEWDEAGTDLEDEWPIAVASPVMVVPDPFGRGDNFDFDLAKVMCDVSVIPSINTPLEESEVQPPSRAVEYDAPATRLVKMWWGRQGIRSLRIPDWHGYRGWCRFRKPFWRRRGDIGCL